MDGTVTARRQEFILEMFEGKRIRLWTADDPLTDEHFVGLFNPHVVAEVQRRLGIEGEPSPGVEVLKAQAAMGNGTDDGRWRPGETAVDALIRERDEAQASASTLTCVLEGLAPRLTEKEARAVAEEILRGVGQYVRTEEYSHTVGQLDLALTRAEKAEAKLAQVTAQRDETTTNAERALDQRDALLAAAKALIAALPKCDHCDRPATRAWQRGKER
jgi:hypothetical protein